MTLYRMLAVARIIPRSTVSPSTLRCLGGIPVNSGRATVILNGFANRPILEGERSKAFISREEAQHTPQSFLLEDSASPHYPLVTPGTYPLSSDMDIAAFPLLYRT
jgi:hypothetical protein